MINTRYFLAEILEKRRIIGFSNRFVKNIYTERGFYINYTRIIIGLTLDVISYRVSFRRINVYGWGKIRIIGIPSENEMSLFMETLG